MRWLQNGSRSRIDPIVRRTDHQNDHFGGCGLLSFLTVEMPMRGAPTASEATNNAGIQRASSLLASATEVVNSVSGDHKANQADNDSALNKDQRTHITANVPAVRKASEMLS